VIEWTCPATVTLPVRDVVDAFAPIAYVTMPAPLPLAPPVIAIHPALAVAVHEQPAATVTATVPLPPPLSIVAVPGEIVSEQVGVGSVGELFSQLISPADSNVASDAQTTSRVLMSHP
jgi:hypothetical protein